MTNLTYQSARNLYNSGYILVNPTPTTPTVIFQLLGYHFTSTKKRTHGRHYKLDDKNWATKSNSILSRINLILTKEVYLLKDSNV